jgi:hypothetical protein
MLFPSDTRGIYRPRSIGIFSRLLEARMLEHFRTHQRPKEINQQQQGDGGNDDEFGSHGLKSPECMGVQNENGEQANRGQYKDGIRHDVRSFSCPKLLLQVQTMTLNESRMRPNLVGVTYAKHPFVSADIRRARPVRRHD